MYHILEYSREEIMNTPNKLTLLRILLVPFFVLFLLLPSIPHHYLLAGLVLTAALPANMDRSRILESLPIRWQIRFW